MSDRTRINNNTNTAQINTLLADPLKVQIAEVLSVEELSSDEVSEILHVDKKKVVHNLELLADSHVITRHVRNHQETYTVLSAQVKETIHILYGLWADSIRSPHEYAEVTI